MADEVKAAVATEIPAVTTDNEEGSEGKVAIYEMIAAYVKDKTEKRIGKAGGREIFDMVVEQVFKWATKEGSFRFNGGFGSFHVREYGEGSRRLPSGATVTFGERKKLRYEEGICVSALVGNTGDLEEALKARGVRTPREKAETPTPPAKEKKAKEEKAPKPATPAAAPAPAPAAPTVPTVAPTGDEASLDLE